ncbi:MAG: glycerate kinase [Mycobacteriaceae bacterium]
MTRVLIASDKFKGSLTAAQVADALMTGIHRVRPGTTVAAAPVADGGDGTLVAALAAGYTEVRLTASGPTGAPGRTRYARSGDLAVVELAEVCGLGLLAPDRLAPMTATSRGVGEVIAAAVDQGCRRIVLGIGGSASTDGGAGMVAALGARLLDDAGREVTDGGGGLAQVTGLVLDTLRAKMSGVEVAVASDVTNPLTGPLGAAAVYGPQKGADPAQVAALDAALGRWADVVATVTGCDERDHAGAGAAGGVGFGAVALLGATMRSGVELVLELIGFDALLDGADLVITGEGSLDEQTLHGKAPIGVTRAARAVGAPVVAVCGSSTLPEELLRENGIQETFRLTDLEPDVSRCISGAAALLESVGEQIARTYLPAQPSTPADGGGA